MIKETTEICFSARIEVKIRGDFVTFSDGLVTITEQVDEEKLLYLTQVLKSHARREITDFAALEKIFSFNKLSDFNLKKLSNHIKHN